MMDNGKFADNPFRTRNFLNGTLVNKLQTFK